MLAEIVWVRGTILVRKVIHNRGDFYRQSLNFTLTISSYKNYTFQLGAHRAGEGACNQYKRQNSNMVDAY